MQAGADSRGDNEIKITVKEFMSKLNIYQRILEIMADIDYIEKGSAKVNGQYRFVSHDQVTAKVHPFLVKHGVVVIPTIDEMQQDGNRTTVKLSIQFINVHNPEDRFTVISYGQGIDNADKGVGKAYSYAYKYALLKTLNLETGDDPDSNAKSEYKADKPQEIENPEKLKEKLDALIETLDDEKKHLGKEFIEKYASYWKKSVSQAINDYKDKSKFSRDLEKWHKKHQKTA